VNDFIGDNVEQDISRRDIIQAAVDGVKEREEPAKPDVETPAIEKPAVEAVDKPAIDRPRDDAGKFVADKPKRGRPTNADREARLRSIKEQLSGKSLKPDTKPEAEVKPEVKPDVQPEAKPEPVKLESEVKPEAKVDEARADVPGSLKAHIKAKWGEIPQDVKEEIRRLEARGSAESARIGPELNFAREMKAIFQPHESMLAAEGATPVQAAKNLLDLVSVLRNGDPSQKQQALMYLAQSYQVPLWQQGGQDAPSSDPMADPRVRQLHEENQRLLNFHKQQAETQQRQANEANMKVLQEFASEKDERGNIKHPLDATIGPKFMQHVNAVRAENPTWDTRRLLDQAYENLSWTIPELRQLRLQREQEKKQAEEAKQLAEKRQAAVQVKGSPPNAAASKLNPKDRREAIKAALAHASR